IERPDLMLKSPIKRNARVVNMSELGKALTQLDKPPVKAIFVYNSNPAVVAPNSNDVVRGFMRPDLFTVVHEQFFTDTVSYADLLLPATTFFEHKDLQTGYGHYLLQISEKAIEPLGYCSSNTDLFRELALRMEFPEDCFRQSVDEMIDLALRERDGEPAPDRHNYLEGVTRERLEKEGHVRFNVGDQAGSFLPFARGGFFTASGKAELYSAGLAMAGLDPVASFIAPKESRHAEAARAFPLELLSRKADNYLNTTFCNVDSLKKLEDPELLEINSTDAAKRGIAEGDWVRVYNDRGEVRLKAHVNGAVQTGVVA